MSNKRPPSPARQRIEQAQQRLHQVVKVSSTRRAQGQDELLTRVQKNSDTIEELSAKMEDDGQGEVLEEVQGQVETLRADLANERAQRGEAEARLDVAESSLARLGGEMSELRAAMETEKKVKEEMENTMMKLLEGLCARVQTEIKEERDEREEVESMMLKLLEDSLQNIEDGNGTVGVSRNLEKSLSH